jgi:hypothetical protein
MSAMARFYRSARTADRRFAVGLDERGVEAADAREAGREGDGGGGDRHPRALQQRARPLHATAARQRDRRRAEIAAAQPAQVPRADAQLLREVVDRALVEEPAVDQPQRARDGGGGAAPRRRAGRGLRPAAQAGAEAGSLGVGRGGEVDDVARARRPHRTRRAAVDARDAHAREEAPVEPRIAREPRTVARLPVEHARA